MEVTLIHPSLTGQWLSFAEQVFGSCSGLRDGAYHLSHAKVLQVLLAYSKRARLCQETPYNSHKAVGHSLEHFFLRSGIYHCEELTDEDGVALGPADATWLVGAGASTSQK